MKRYQGQTSSILILVFVFQLLACEIHYAQSPAPRLRFVAAEDGAATVDGEVHYLPSRGGNIVIGRSNAGIADLKETPQQGDLLYLLPDSTDYSSKKFRWAPKNNTVQVDRSPRSRDAVALFAALATARREANPALVALITNDLSTKPEVKEKAPYEQQTYREAAVSFGIPVERAVTYDPVQGKTVPSTDLTNAVKEFQKEQGLKTTGSINYPTLKAKSGTSIPDVIAHSEVKSQR